MCEKPKEEDAYDLLRKGRRLLEEGHPMQAVMLLETARAAAPGKGSILEPLGKAYYSCGRFEEAVASFNEALEADPSNDYAHYCLGLCCIKTGRKAEAGGHFKLAWSLRPDDMYREKAARYGAAGAPGDGTDGKAGRAAGSQGDGPGTAAD